MPFSNDDLYTCDRELTLEEFSISINSSENDKSPGSDGFSVNLYKKFWHLIGNYVLDSLNYAYSHDCLSHDQSTSFITLILEPDILHSLKFTYQFNH